jgi:hypothetical protein
MKKILYRLSWFGGDNWSFHIGLTTPDSLHHMFEDGTLFTAGGRTSYASSTPDEAMTSAEARIKLQMEEDQRRLRAMQEQLAVSEKLHATLVQQREELRKESELILDCVKKIEQFFKGDVHRARAWFKVPNPLLGQVSPDDMIAMHRVEKLHKFIALQMAENASP